MKILIAILFGAIWCVGTYGVMHIPVDIDPETNQQINEWLPWIAEIILSIVCSGVAWILISCQVSYSDEEQSSQGHYGSGSTMFDAHIHAQRVVRGKRGRFFGDNNLH